MKKRPVIGVVSARHMDGFYLPLYRTTGHYLEQIEAAGGIPLQLPLLPTAKPGDAAALAALCDGFLLPGGGDFDPGWYGQSLRPGLAPGDLDYASQAAGIALTRAAAASGKPVLGICLGAQVLTIALGGSLIQDIPTQVEGAVCHSAPAQCLEQRWQTAHTVRTAPGSLLRRLCGEEVGVNSFHHQAVLAPAPGFAATAWAPDGVIEAVESENHRLLGVQWHPENLAHAGDAAARALFRWLVETAAE